MIVLWWFVLSAESGHTMPCLACRPVWNISTPPPDWVIYYLHSALHIADCMLIKCQLAPHHVSHCLFIAHRYQSTSREITVDITPICTGYHHVWKPDRMPVPVLAKDRTSGSLFTQHVCTTVQVWIAYKGANLILLLSPCQWNVQVLISPLQPAHLSRTLNLPEAQLSCHTSCILHIAKHYKHFPTTRCTVLLWTVVVQFGKENASII